jgi:hypothetical protein
MPLLDLLVKPLEGGRYRVFQDRPHRYYGGYPDPLDAGILAPATDIVIMAPPNGKGWNVLAAQVEINTTIAAGDRFLMIRVLPKGNLAGNPLVISGLPPVGPLLLGYYYLFQNGGAFQFAVPAVAIGYVFPLPADGELKDEAVEFSIIGAQAGDTLRVFWYYEEFEYIRGAE